MADRKLLAQFFTAHASQVVSFLRRRAPRNVEPEDLRQEVYLRMLRIDPTTIRDPRGYLMTVANNVLREASYSEGPRREWIRVALEEALQNETALRDELSPDMSTDQDEQLSILRRAVATLAEKDQQLLAMRFRDGLTYRGMARELGWASKTAAEKAVAAAVARCRDQMKRMGAS
jgi:RNA polymerase sigma-70 factor (ECF subfamily)